jgi:hypothetical protein
VVLSRAGRRLASWVALGFVLEASVAAQTLAPGPPGPFVLDVRLVTSGVPSGEAFYAGLPEGATVPTRGFGVNVGGHVFPLGIGPARLGFGADVMIARGSTVDASATLTTVAPQLSANFGTADGWSYLSAGVGAARVSVDPGVSATVRSINAGGGARWFLGPHLGIGFDVRFHMMAAGEDSVVEIPETTSVSLAVGVSVK